MENKKQSSIEWLIEQLLELDKLLDGRRKNEDATVLKMNPTKIFQQAKELHKREIIKSFEQGLEDGYHFEGSASDYESEGLSNHLSEQYYNQNFNK
jgi:hypothetical protein